jgi:tetratricopeptide (TPR) repeat protein
MYHLPNFQQRVQVNRSRANNEMTPLQPTTDVANAPDVRPPSARRLPYFALIALAIVLLAVLRSAIATHRDSFTIDENYHVVAGVSYFRTGDYRINPEHPPLVKLWVGAFIPESVLHLPPLQIVNDKKGERTFAAETVFLKNDPDRIQRYARFAMYSFNGILLFVFALVARRVFGDAIALGALVFLAIDPTVAAHMPVVMTDLPVTLIGAIALLSAWLAFQSWKPPAIAGAAIALGLTLATKHSGIIFAVFIALFGLYMSVRNIPATSENSYGLTPTCRRRLFLLAALLVGACAVLWSTYRFHFHESPTTQETFNRPLTEKISDLQSPRNRFVIANLARFHVFPRSYLWGFADIIRAGVEGRGFPIYFMDRIYIEKKPLYFFPVQMLIKIPLGLMILSIAGFLLFLARRTQPDDRPQFWFIVVFSLFFIATLATSHSFYAGVRHALPAYPALALFAGALAAIAVRQKSPVWKTLVAASAAWAIVSAVPVPRPWEYHNALAGGTSRAYLHFSDEGIDLGLRIKDLAAYYHRVLEPRGELPNYIGYLPSDEELVARGIHTIDEKWDSGELPDNSSTIQGTLIVEAIEVNSLLQNGLGPLTRIEPTERIGNLLIYRGSFDLPDWRALRLFFRGRTALFSPKGGPAKALPLFQQAVEFNPQFYPAWIELGNLQAQRAEREVAIHAFEQALASLPQVGAFRTVLIDHLAQLRSAPDVTQVRPVRDPFDE